VYRQATNKQNKPVVRQLHVLNYYLLDCLLIYLCDPFASCRAGLSYSHHSRYMVFRRYIRAEETQVAESLHTRLRRFPHHCYYRTGGGHTRGPAVGHDTVVGLLDTGESWLRLVSRSIAVIANEHDVMEIMELILL